MKVLDRCQKEHKVWKNGMDAFFGHLLKPCDIVMLMMLENVTEFVLLIRRSRLSDAPSSRRSIYGMGSHRAAVADGPTNVDVLCARRDSGTAARQWEKKKRRPGGNGLTNKIIFYG